MRQLLQDHAFLIVDVVCPPDSDPTFVRDAAERGREPFGSWIGEDVLRDPRFVRGCAVPNDAAETSGDDECAARAAATI